MYLIEFSLLYLQIVASFICAAPVAHWTTFEFQLTIEDIVSFIVNPFCDVHK